MAFDLMLSYLEGSMVHHEPIMFKSGILQIQLDDYLTCIDADSRHIVLFLQGTSRVANLNPISFATKWQVRSAKQMLPAHKLPNQTHPVVDMPDMR